MGFSILDMVLGELRNAEFKADVAYPGQKFPQVTEPVAAVHIAKVDRSRLSVTVEVNIICPASMGGTACEVEALRATEVLRWAGATCVQNGCSYDGVGQVYVVAVLATFTCITEEDSCIMGPGFLVYINDLLHHSIVNFWEEEVKEWQAQYEMGENLPTGISPGKTCWAIGLEEQIPAGSAEMEEPSGAFKLRLVSEGKTETFYHCRWTSTRREFTQEGVRRIRKGIAMLREVE